MSTPLPQQPFSNPSMHLENHIEADASTLASIKDPIPFPVNGVAVARPGSLMDDAESLAARFLALSKSRSASHSATTDKAKAALEASAQAIQQNTVHKASHVAEIINSVSTSLKTPLANEMSKAHSSVQDLTHQKEEAEAVQNKFSQAKAIQPQQPSSSAAMQPSKIQDTKPQEQKIDQPKASIAINTSSDHAKAKTQEKPQEKISVQTAKIKEASQAAQSKKSESSLNPDIAFAPFNAVLEKGVNDLRHTYSKTQEATEGFQQALTASATVTSQGLIELNNKMIDLFQSQSDAMLDIWKQILSAGSVSEAVKIQTSGLREAYEHSSSQWKDIAQSTNRIVTDCLQPIQGLVSRDKS